MPSSLLLNFKPMENQSKQEIESIVLENVKTLFEKMGFEVEVSISHNEKEDDEEKILCNIKTNESGFLIGQYGGHLEAIEQLARLIIRNKIQQRVRFVLDINSYRQEKNESVIFLARNMAEKALVEKRAVVLRPMTPYERRLVHMELADNNQVSTESMGEGENRKVIIKPVGLV